MGLAGLGILLWTRGSVSLLVVLYSVSVFLTFAVSLFGLCVYWWRNRRQGKWIGRFSLSALGFVVCSGILSMLMAEKFAEGGWIAFVIIVAITGFCLLVHRHYDWTKVQIRKVDEIFANQPYGSVVTPPKLDPSKPTAVFLVGSSRGGGLHTLLWVARLFPNHFKNFVFVNVRTVDSHVYGGDEAVAAMKMDANVALTYFVNFCNSNGWAAKSYLAFGTDPIEEFTRLAKQVEGDFPGCIFFTSKLIFEQENWFTRLLHNQAALVIQRRLHLLGMQMVILPMKV
jgi:hypothetical protein